MIQMITPVTTWNLIRPERLSRCIVQDQLVDDQFPDGMFRFEKVMKGADIT